MYYVLTHNAIMYYVLTHNAIMYYVLIMLLCIMC